MYIYTLILTILEIFIYLFLLQYLMTFQENKKKIPTAGISGFLFQKITISLKNIVR